MTTHDHPRLSLAAALVLLLGVTALCAAPYKADPGPHDVTRRLDVWTDPARTRDIPLKFYYPAEGEGPFPVLLFSHGLGGSREGALYLGRHWASHGYVCIFLQHHGSDEAVWRGLPPGEIMPAMRKVLADPQNAINRPLDVRFVMDQLERLNRDDAALEGRLDLERIGMAGHSFGAWTTQAVAGQGFMQRGASRALLHDARVKAAVMLSPVARRNDPRHLFAGIRIPALHLTGTDDHSAVTDSGPADRRIPFDSITAPQQYLVILTGGDHMVFNGHARVGPRARRDERHHDLIRQSTTAFWDAHLRGEAPAREWLEVDLAGVLGNDGTLERK
jgi:predicted dienelactone hydrolase